MLDLRFSLDPRNPEVHHAGIFSGQPESLEPSHTIAYVNGRLVQWKVPIGVEQLVSWEVRASVVRFLQRVCFGLAILGSIALLWSLVDEILTGDLRMLLSRRTPPILLFWVGVGSALVHHFLRESEETTTPSLPRRAFDEQLHPLPTPVDPHALATSAVGEILILDPYLTPAARVLLARGFQVAQQHGAPALRPVHLLVAAEREWEMAIFCARLSISFRALSLRLQHVLASGEGAAVETRCDQVTYALLLGAYVETYRERRRVVDVIELLLACFTVDERLREILLDLGVTIDDARNVGQWIHHSQEYRKRWRHLRTLARHKPKHHMDRAMTARPTPFLDALATDYTQIARVGGFPYLVGRDVELGEAFRILKGRLGNILFVGEAGTGKSELLKGIATLMAAEDVPAHLRDKRLVVLDPGALIAWGEGTGGLERALQRVIVEVANAGNILLGIEDIHHLLGAGSTRSSEDAGHMLMNALSEGYLHVVATTTTQEFAKYIQPVETFLRRFQVIRVPEMDCFATIRVMEAMAGALEARHQVFYSFPALKYCYDLCDQYISDRHFPDKALQTLDEVGALVREARGANSVVMREDVAQVMAEKTNIPVTTVTSSDAEKLLRLEEAMHQRVVGQDEAVWAVASALRRARAGLHPSTRPIATLLFLGPTGVGKTETAKTIAEVYFGSERCMTRLDMSEYQTLDSLAKLLGSPGQTSPFLEEVRLNPHRLLLLDEFEKAHPDLVNVFLQVFDDGRLTDGVSRTVSFVHAMIIVTSNVGSLRIQEGISAGESAEQIREELLKEELPTVFRPELLNRFDHIVVFSPLTRADMVNVARLQLQPLVQTLQSKGITLEVHDGALRDLAEKGYDPRNGVRPLRRVVQNDIEDPIATMILEGSVQRRDTIVVEEGGKIWVRKAKDL